MLPLRVRILVDKQKKKRLSNCLLKADIVDCINYISLAINLSATQMWYLFRGLITR